MRPAVQLALVVHHVVGLTGDGGGSAVRQGAAHQRDLVLMLLLLHRAVHAVELRGTCGEATAGGSRESFNTAEEEEQEEFLHTAA